MNNTDYSLIDYIQRPTKSYSLWEYLMSTWRTDDREEVEVNDAGGAYTSDEYYEEGN